MTPMKLGDQGDLGSNTLLNAARCAAEARMAVGEALILAEHGAGIGSRLFVRRVAYFFEFALWHWFLRRLEELSESDVFGGFKLWYVPLRNVDPTTAEAPIDDPILAAECIQAILLAEAHLASGATLLLSDPHACSQFRSNPVCAFGHASRILNELKDALLSRHPKALPEDRVYDAHLWSYVEMITPPTPAWTNQRKAQSSPPPSNGIYRFGIDPSRDAYNIRNRGPHDEDPVRSFSDLLAFGNLAFRKPETILNRRLQMLRMSLRDALIDFVSVLHPILEE